METSLKTVKKKLLKSEARISGLKNEESRLLLLNRSLKKSCEKHQKEARRNLFLMDKQARSVDSTKNNKDRDFRALEVKLEKVMEDNKNFQKEIAIKKKENEALLSDVSVKKAEIQLKKETLKMDLAKIALDRQVLNHEAKIHANKQKADLALEHLRVKMASAQAKKDSDAAAKEQALLKKTRRLRKKEESGQVFVIKHGKFHIYLKKYSPKIFNCHFLCFRQMCSYKFVLSPFLHTTT